MEIRSGAGFRAAAVGFFLFAFGGAAWAQQAAPSYSTKCDQQTKPVSYEVCITQMAGSQNPDFLYFMHGRGGNAKEWSSGKGFGHEVEGQWELLGKDAPTVIAISFGPNWLLAEHNASPASGLFELVTRALIPGIEANLGGLHGRRLLFGLSMGGFNASQLLLKRPDLFGRVVLGCPAIASISPYSTEADIEAYIQRTGAVEKTVRGVFSLVKYFYPDEPTWETASQLVLADNGSLGPKTPPVHISCGSEDEYGFFEGAALFASKAREKGVKTVEWVPMKGGHCTMDVDGVARFLVN